MTPRTYPPTGDDEVKRSRQQPQLGGDLGGVVGQQDHPSHQPAQGAQLLAQVVAVAVLHLTSQQLVAHHEQRRRLLGPIW